MVYLQSDHTCSFIHFRVIMHVSYQNKSLGALRLEGFTLTRLPDVRGHKSPSVFQCEGMELYFQVAHMGPDCLVESVMKELKYIIDLLFSVVFFFCFIFKKSYSSLVCIHNKAYLFNSQKSLNYYYTFLVFLLILILY